MQEMKGTQVLSLDGEESLDKDMATHSSIRAWKIPWAEEPGGPRSMGSQRIGHAEQLSTHVHVDVHIHGYVTFCQAA